MPLYSIEKCSFKAKCKITMNIIPENMVVKNMGQIYLIWIKLVYSVNNDNTVK